MTRAALPMMRRQQSGTVGAEKRWGDALRTVVGTVHIGAATVNERTHDLAKPMLDAVGLGHLDNVATAKAAAAAMANYSKN